MAGLRSGKAHWDDLPQQLGLTVDPNGTMFGMWRGVPVSAQFMWVVLPSRNRRDRKPDQPRTLVRAALDPPLGIEGLDNNYYFDHMVDYAFREDLKARAMACGFFDPFFGDAEIHCRVRGRFESNAAVYAAIFDLLAWGAQILQGRRTQAPPPWERAIAEEWPAIAKDWGMQLDRRRGEMAGVARGRPTRVLVSNARGMLMTRVEVAAPLPPGDLLLSVSRRLTTPDFFTSVLSSISPSGSEIKLGDPAFDAAFVVKGAEPVARSILTPTARQHIMSLVQGGAAIGFEQGKLTATVGRFLLRPDELDPFLKATFAAASAMGAAPMPSLPPTPYR